MDGMPHNLETPTYAAIFAFIIYICNWPIFVLSLWWMIGWLGNIFELYGLWLLPLNTYVYCVLVWSAIFSLFELSDFAADEPPKA